MCQSVNLDLFSSLLKNAQFRFFSQFLACFVLFSAPAAAITEDKTIENSVVPALSIVTEDWVPFNYLGESGEITGLATKRVKDLMAEKGISYDITLFPWKRAYNRALKDANVAIYSIYRTKERENDFYWYCPLLDPIPVFAYSLAARDDILVETIEDLVNYKLGVTRGAFVITALKQDGLLERLTINNESDDLTNVSTLLTQRVDLIIDSKEALAYRLKQLNRPISVVREHLQVPLPQVEANCIAFNKKTNPVLLNKFGIRPPDIQKP